ncbi:hypothetical protein DdX_11265 [Ditylenchus destructor]|uniref:DB domain-containing protein n=1 Tax=Ditylenchus destructor TaxID=166010 RepID=A0AAD4R4Q1_9BILA|nr:hypothetical protein DdX_11265 [Ditylenchus destructor]
MCVWVPEIETVEDRGSIRFDPPLLSNEYVRDVMADRLGNGQVIIKAQICKYTVQRTSCDKETMTAEESRFYSLLMLRLSRTKASLAGGPPMKPANASRDNLGSFRDVPPAPSNFHSLSKHVTHTSAAPGSVTQRTTMSPTTVVGETVENFQEEAAKIDSASTNDPAAVAAAGSTHLAGGGLTRIHKDQPLAAWQNEENSVEIQLTSRNGAAAISPRLHSIRLPHLSDFPHRRLRTTHVGSAKDQREIAPSSRNSTLGASNGWRGQDRLHALARRGWPIATNATKELVAAPYQPIGADGKRLDGQLKHDHAGRLLGGVEIYNRKIKERPALRRWAAITTQPPPTPAEEFSLKNDLEVRKLHIGAIDHVLEHTSYGGSFAESATTELSPAPETASTPEVYFLPSIVTPKPRSFPEFEKPISRSFEQRSREEESLKQADSIGSFGSPPLNFSPAPPLAKNPESSHIPGIQNPGIQNPGVPNPGFPQTSLPKAPSFKIIPVTEEKVLRRPYKTSFRPTTPAKKSHLAKERIIQEGLSTEQPKADRKEIKMDWRVQSLLECCQQTAPGCRQLCSGNVSKEEVKQALVSQQCPPLSMTSVIQCFPRFYDIAPVKECCAKPKTAQSALSPQAFPPKSELPQQCLSLCATDFKLSFAHFACIDHISTIVECYHDLMR